jgi:hypothetical protein
LNFAHCCDQMDSSLREGEVAVHYIPKFREYGIAILDGGSSLMKISFCPWCGKRLPEGLRNDWFERLEHLGQDPWSEDLPAEFRSDAWWKAKEF